MKTFGKYEVVEKIGEGGFGVIYKGWDPLIKRSVAIKTCTSEEQEVRDRFFREAEIAGNFQFPHIVTVFDFGIENGIPYLVQEYLEGEDLDSKIRRRETLLFPTRLDYLVQIARGLEFAHGKGVVHRDIKPGNIRVLPDGTVKIMDFGIAKLAAGHTAVTQAGQTLGTAAYLAPEQIKGHHVDQRADIFSFGLLAYELLTYERPFHADHPSTVLFKILSDVPSPITAHWARCPPELVRIVDLCMQKSPEERYQSSRDLLADLTRLQARYREEDEEDTHGQEVADAERATVSLPQRGVEPAPSQPVSSVPSAAAGRDPLSRSGTTARLGAQPFDSPRHPPSPHDTVPVGRLDRLDLELRHPPAPSDAPTRRRRGLGPALVVGLVVVVALAAGIGLGLRQRLPGSVPLPAVVEAMIERGSEDSLEPSEREPSVAPVPPAGQGTAEEPIPATEEPLDAPPAEPTPGTLRIPSSWTPDLTVRVDGGAPHRLEGGLTLELPPGSHSLRFALDLEGYVAEENRTIRLEAGEELRLPVPIPPPAFLTVQNKPGSPQGWITVGEERLGWSPVRERLLPPGRYRLRISPEREGGREDVMVEELHLEPSTDVIVTFDLRTRSEPVLVRRPRTGSAWR